MKSEIIGAIDQQGRCKHYHSPLDIIAIQLKCCGKFYACIRCHEETSGHEASQWEREEFENNAIQCGNCSNTLTITQYLESNSTCKHCGSLFNPKCENHYHFYFKL